MTIGLGFVSRGGVVLSADRQLTVTGYYKDHVPKLKVFEHPECRVVSTYAYLPSLANVLNDRVELTLNTIQKPHGEEIVEIITTETRKLKKQYPSEMRHQHFLFAFSAFAETARLIRISGGIIDEPQWACIGIGDSSLVRHLVAQITKIPPAYLPTTEVARLAVYIVGQAKEYVDGCGGKTDTAIVYDGGERATDGIRPDEIERDFESLRFCFQKLYNIWTNVDVSESDRNRMVNELGEFIRVKKSVSWPTEPEPLSEQ
jgi:20S proteasome alpha/beta subunit